MTKTTHSSLSPQFYAALLPFRDPYLGSSSKKIYADMFGSCSYPDKEWWVSRSVCTRLTLKSRQALPIHSTCNASPPSAVMKRCRIIIFLFLFTSRNERLLVKNTLTLGGYIKMVETFSPYQKMLRDNPAEAKCLSDGIQSRWVTPCTRRVGKGSSSQPSLPTLLCHFQVDVRHEGVISWHRAHGGYQVLLLVGTQAFISLMKSWKNLKKS